MAARVCGFRSEADRLRDDRAELARQYVLDLEAQGCVPSECVGPVVAAIDAERVVAGSDWRFVMVGPRENLAIVRWLQARSKRPVAAVRLWAVLLTGLRGDTLEVCFSRSELAREVGIAARGVSEIMTELESVGAISRRRDGRGVRYFLHPKAGTCLASPARERAQREAGPLALQLVT